MLWWLDRKNGRSRQRTRIRSKERDGFLDRARLHDDAAEQVDSVHDLRQLGHYRLQFFQTCMVSGSALKVQEGRSLVALPADVANEGLPCRVQIRLHPRHFVAVLGIAAALEARRKAHL